MSIYFIFDHPNASIFGYKYYAATDCWTILLREVWIDVFVLVMRLVLYDERKIVCITNSQIKLRLN